MIDSSAGHIINCSCFYSQVKSHPAQSDQPTNRPTDQPTNRPTDHPTNQPTDQPTQRAPLD
ncbi:MAG: PT domain-containing protein [Anaerolineales bacterium]|nr:PT domain-containing protein [Anaerolineales bacterium]